MQQVKTHSQVASHLLAGINSLYWTTSPQKKLIFFNLIQ